mmetsp:Transcript_55520/g.127552  ORF Transcript_55520/g.127552 Transcript_55520/m.127552 type:complete len:264 (-) Transcript_55520:17-808(-)
MRALEVVRVAPVVEGLHALPRSVRDVGITIVGVAQASQKLEVDEARQVRKARVARRPHVLKVPLEAWLNAKAITCNERLSGQACRLVADGPVAGWHTGDGRRQRERKESVVVRGTAGVFREVDAALLSRRAAVPDAEGLVVELVVGEGRAHEVRCAFGHLKVPHPGRLRELIGPRRPRVLECHLLVLRNQETHCRDVAIRGIEPIRLNGSVARRFGRRRNRINHCAPPPSHLAPRSVRPRVRGIIRRLENERGRERDSAEEDH